MHYRYLQFVFVRPSVTSITMLCLFASQWCGAVANPARCDCNTNLSKQRSVRSHEQSNNLTYFASLDVCIAMWPHTLTFGNCISGSKRFQGKCSLHGTLHFEDGGNNFLRKVGKRRKQLLMPEDRNAGYLWLMDFINGFLNSVCFHDWVKSLD